MNSLTETLKEYFFGTETRRWCQWKDHFYREHFEHKTRRLEDQIYDSKLGQHIFFNFGKRIPNLLDITFVVAAVAEKNPAYLMGIGYAEVMRHIFSRSMKEFRETISPEIERIKQLQKEAYERDQEGEEWKDNYF